MNICETGAPLVLEATVCTRVRGKVLGQDISDCLVPILHP